MGQKAQYSEDNVQIQFNARLNSDIDGELMRYLRTIEDEIRADRIENQNHHGISARDILIRLCEYAQQKPRRVPERQKFMEEVGSFVSAQVTASVRDMIGKIAVMHGETKEVYDPMVEEFDDDLFNAIQSGGRVEESD